MKRIKLLCLLAVILIVYPLGASQAQTYKFTVPDSITAYPGQTNVLVPVYFTQTAGVYYFRVELDYDPNKLEFVSVTDGRFHIGSANTNFCGAGYLHVFSSMSCIQPGSNPAFYVYFNVKYTVPVGSLISLTFHDPFCYSLQAVVNGCAPSYPAYSPTYDFGSIYVVSPPEYKFTIADNIPAYPGQIDLKVPVYFNQAAGVNYFRVQLNYDPNKLEFRSVTDGRFHISSANTDFCGAGFLHIFSFTDLGTCIQPGSEPACSVYFNVKSTVPVGSVIPLTFSDPFCYSLQAVVNGCPPSYPAFSPTYDFGSVYVNQSAPELKFVISDNIVAYPGQTDLSVPVYFNQSIGVNYFRVELNYDPTKLEYQSVTDGRFHISSAGITFCGAGYLHIFSFTGLETCIQPGSNPACYVHFKVKDLVPVGTLIPLTFSDPFCYGLQAVVNGCPPSYPAFVPTYDFGSIWVNHKGVRFTITDNIQAYAGNNVRLPVYVHNEEGLIYFRVDLAYDSTKLTYNGVEDGRFHVINTGFCGNNPYHVSVFSNNTNCISADPNYPGGVGFYINLIVKSSVPVGTVIPINFTDTTCNLIQTLANGCAPVYSTFLPEWDNGSIKVIQHQSGCPFVYSWTGKQFEQDNTILTQSENPNRADQMVTDYLSLKKKPALVDNKYRLQIKEFEHEVSYLDNLELILVDHSENTNVAVSPDGQIHLYDHQIAPLFCVDQNGVDQLDKIREKDGIYYECEGPGYLILTVGKDKDQIDLPTFFGLGPAPPAKNIDKIAGSFQLPVVKIAVEGKDGSWIELSDLPPRSDPEQAFCFIGPEYFNERGEMKVKVSWTSFYSTDEIKYFVVSPEKPQLHPDLLGEASHSIQGKIASQLMEEDREFAVLSPGEQIELTFLSPGEPAPGLKRDFILKSSGYYVQQEKTAGNSLPSTCELLGNYPNPFNMETIISYVLSKEAFVELNIYNVLGEKVRTLVAEHQTAGSKKISWDGKDNRGNEVTSGAYFYRLKADTEVYIKKMLLLK